MLKKNLILFNTAEGYCYNDTGRFGFSLFVIVITFVQAIIIIIVFVLRLDKKMTQINVPLSLLLNDGIELILYFIISTLSLLSIVRCDSMVAARVIAALFVLSLFLVLVGLLYTDYVAWQKNISKEHSKEMGTTITESSPTVLT